MKSEWRFAQCSLKTTLLQRATLVGMSNPEREIPQRELRNDISRILKQVGEGKSVRVTVKGRPVADLVPVSSGRRFVPRAEVERLLLEAPLDEAFKRDVDAVVGATIEEL